MATTFGWKPLSSWSNCLKRDDGLPSMSQGVAIAKTSIAGRIRRELLGSSDLRNKIAYFRSMVVDSDSIQFAAVGPNRATSGSRRLSTLASLARILNGSLKCPSG